MNDSRKATGKVIDLQASGKWTSKKGTSEEKTMYRFDITIDTETGEESGQISFDTNDPPVKFGDTVNVSIYPAKGDYPPSIYLDKPKANGFAGKAGGGKNWTPDPERESRRERWMKQILIGRQACLNTAASLISAGCGASTVENLTGIAEQLEAWTKRGLDLKSLTAPVAPAPAQPAAPQTPPPAPKPAPVAVSPQGEDDLPF